MSAYVYHYSDEHGKKVEELPEGSVRIVVLDWYGGPANSIYIDKRGYVFVKEGEVRLTSWWEKNGHERWTGIIFSVTNGVAEKVGEYDPKKAEKKAFGVEQRRILVEDMMLPEAVASKILRAAGPGRAVQSAQIALELSSRMGRDGLKALTYAMSYIAHGGETGYGRDRKCQAVMDIGLPEINGSANVIQKVLEGVIAAIDADIPTPAEIEAKKQEALVKAEAEAEAARLEALKPKFGGTLEKKLKEKGVI